VLNRAVKICHFLRGEAEEKAGYRVQSNFGLVGEEVA
jgi:hypothetical protein